MNYQCKIGILGGAGPLASAQFQIDLLEAARLRWACVDDFDYPAICHISQGYPGLTGQGLEDPNRAIPKVIEAVELMAQAGCTHIVMPCNSLHVLVPQIRTTCKIPVVDMIEATQQECFRRLALKDRPVVVLSSESTRASGLYQKILQCRGAIGPAGQAEVTRLIEAVMRQGATPELKGGLATFIASLPLKDPLVVLGCTELSLLRPTAPDSSVVDSSTSLISTLLSQIEHENLQRAA